MRGEALSLVVIDKLPFAPPDDPVLAARIEHMQREGRNAFMEYQLPRAVISVKQGAGRLIRDETDRGVLMICDPRLIAKPYGRASGAACRRCGARGTCPKCSRSSPRSNAMARSGCRAARRGAGRRRC